MQSTPVINIRSSATARASFNKIYSHYNKFDEDLVHLIRRCVTIDGNNRFCILKVL